MSGNAKKTNMIWLDEEIKTVIATLAPTGLPWTKETLEEIELPQVLAALKCNEGREARNINAILSYGRIIFGLSSCHTLNDQGKAVLLEGCEPKTVVRESSWTQEKKNRLQLLLDTHSKGWRTSRVPQKTVEHITMLFNEMLPKYTHIYTAPAIRTAITKLQHENGKPKEAKQRKPLQPHDVPTAQPPETLTPPSDQSLGSTNTFFHSPSENFLVESGQMKLPLGAPQQPPAPPTAENGQVAPLPEPPLEQMQTPVSSSAMSKLEEMGSDESVNRFHLHCGIVEATHFVVRKFNKSKVISFTVKNPEEAKALMLRIYAQYGASEQTQETTMPPAAAKSCLLNERSNQLLGELLWDGRYGSTISDIIDVALLRLLSDAIEETDKEAAESLKKANRLRKLIM